jgi:hypothetical protein
MSHFSVIVFVPCDTPPDRLEVEVEKRLAAYDENIEVEPYDTPCFCVGQKARSEAEQHANLLYGDHGTRRAQAQAMMDAQTDVTWPQMHPEGSHVTDAETKQFSAQVQAYTAKFDTFWQQTLQPWRTARDAYFAAHPERERPNPTCSECQGTGTVRTTYNPASKWDWWKIGGRWNGELAPVAQRGNEQTQNVTRAVDLPEDWVPFAIVTETGEWHERAKMGWWAMTTNEKDDDAWNAEAAEIASGHANHLAVLVDCHI